MCSGACLGNRAIDARIQYQLGVTGFYQQSWYLATARGRTAGAAG